MSTQINLDGHLIQMRIKCHFFITATKTDRRNKMIAMYLRTLITKILFFIIIKPPLFSRLEVDTQQLIFPMKSIPLVNLQYNRTNKKTLKISNLCYTCIS